MNLKRMISSVIALIMVLSLAMPLLTVSAAEEEPLKKRVTYYTEERVNNALLNIKKGSSRKVGG